MITQVLIAVLSIGIITLALSLSLAFASKKFSSKENKKVQQVFEALPQNNCGACGYPSCLAFAKSIVDNPDESSYCRLGGEEVAEEVAKILGVQVPVRESFVAVVSCKGGSLQKFDYLGIRSCKAAMVVSEGQIACPYGCLGFGDCIQACGFGAIQIKDNLPLIDRQKCTGCGICIVSCPRKLLSLAKKSSKVAVKCSSRDPAKLTAKNCSVGCISCGICVQKCQSSAISIENNHAVIDHKKCNDCGTCSEFCPRKVIAFCG